MSSVLVLVAGLAKLDHHPGRAFLGLFVDACMAMRLRGFDPQNLSNIINGEHGEGVQVELSPAVGVCDDFVLMAGFAKLNHNPRPAFLELFVDACMATRLQGFKPQALSNVINGE
jgi:hypothetical protein